MTQFKRWFLPLLFPLFFSSIKLSAANRVFDFEGPARVWRGDEVAAGPWLQNEWRAFGTQALKADISLQDGGAYYLNIRDVGDLRNFGWMSATVTRSWWGNFQGEFMARLYVKTGDDWQWHEGVTVPVAQPFGNFYYAHNTVLDLDLSQVKNLDRVREIGVQFLSKGYNTGAAAIYLDQLTLVEKTEPRIFPRWVRSAPPIADGFGRYFVTENERLGRLDLQSGQLKWSQRFDRPVRFYFPRVNPDEALYAVGEGAIWSLQKETGLVHWQRPLRPGLAATVLADSEGGIYLSTATGDHGLIALNKSDGSLLWQAPGVQPASIQAFGSDLTNRIFSRNGIVLAQSRDPMSDQLIIIGLDRLTGRRLWEYKEPAVTYLDLYVHTQGQLLVRSSGSRNHLAALDLQSGQILWDYENASSFAIETGVVWDRILLLRGSYEAPGLIALDVNNGQVQWTFQNSAYFSVTTDHNALLYVQSYNGGQQSLSALNADGKLLWNHSFSGYASIQKNGIFFTELLENRTRLTVVDRESGDPIWFYNSNQPYITIPSDERDLAILDGRDLKAFDPLQGQLIWTYTLPEGASVLQVDSENYYVQLPHSNGKGPSDLAAIQKDSGRLVWTYSPGYYVSGFQLGHPRATTVDGLLLLQYQVGSKFPISQGVIALPQRKS